MEKLEYMELRKRKDEMLKDAVAPPALYGFEPRMLNVRKRVTVRVIETKC